MRGGGGALIVGAYGRGLLDVPMFSPNMRGCESHWEEGEHAARTVSVHDPGPVIKGPALAGTHTCHTPKPRRSERGQGGSLRSTWHDRPKYRAHENVVLCLGSMGPTTDKPPGVAQTVREKKKQTLGMGMREEAQAQRLSYRLPAPGSGTTCRLQR